MDAASRYFVQIDELADAVGRRFAELTGAEWGRILSRQNWGPFSACFRMRSRSRATTSGRRPAGNVNVSTGFPIRTMATRQASASVELPQND
jgi:hypothetical protein